MTRHALSSPGLDELLQCAEAAARAAGRHALEQERRRNEVFQASAHDVKLKLDLECQAIADEAIRKRFPDHLIFGEESGEKGDPNATLIWIIDPIDGTVNFSHGLQLWCCSVAALSNGETIAGAVFAPVLDECYTARRGGPACCNGNPIAVSKTSRVEDAIVATGIDRKTRELSESIRLFERLTQRVQRPRIMGSAALDICHVACGKSDGYYESGIYLWDAAAGRIIVEQAGGRSEILRRDGDLRISFMATNGRIHETLKQIVIPAWRPTP